MNQTQRVESSQRTVPRGPLLDKDHGYFNSATVALPPLEIFHFCQNDQNIKQVLTNLPIDVENFLDLTLKSAEQVSTDEFQITWHNRPGSRFTGTLIFLLKKAPVNRGTIVTTEAQFSRINLKSEKPSTLINMFLKRMKSLIETGEIATTRGQPSGREEISPTENKTLH